MDDGLVIMDDDGNEVALDAREAEGLLAIAGRLEAATVSACPDCRCRVIAAVAFSTCSRRPRRIRAAGELIDLADDAPTLHLYVIDPVTACEHPRWRDPLSDEWAEAVEEAERARH